MQRSAPDCCQSGANYPIFQQLQSPESRPTDGEAVFQWEGNLTRCPWDLTPALLLIQQMHDPYEWDNVGKGNDDNMLL